MKNTPQLRSYFKSLIALVTNMRVCPASRPGVAMKLTTLFLAVSAAAGLTLSSQAQISVTASPGVPNAFNALPAVTEWSTMSIGGGAGDITTAAALDAQIIATINAASANNVLPTASDFPVTQNGLARWNNHASGFFLQTRPTGVRYTILMATLRNDSGNTLANLDVSYDWNQYNALPVNESMAGHRVYVSLSGSPGDWTVVPGLSTFNNSSSAQALTATIPLLAGWPSGANLYLIFVDDNGPGGTGNPQEGGYSIDNVSFTGKGAVLLPNALNIGRNKIGTVTDNGFGSFTVVGGGNDIWDQNDEFTYAYTEVTGDFDVQVRVESLTPNARWSKAGLMARESLSEYGRMAFARVTPSDVPTTSGGNGANDVGMAFRTGLDNTSGVNGGQNDPASPAPNYPNAWLRLSRIGNVVFASNSLDGVTWALRTSQDTATWGGGALPATLNLGLAASRHSGGPTATAEFRQLQFNYGPAFDVRSVSSRGNPNGILVEFSKPAGASAYFPANYTVDGGITVSDVVPGPTTRFVRLVTSTLTEGTTYTVTAAGVSAQDSTAIGVATASFVHGAGYEANAIHITHNKTGDSGFYRNSDAVAKGLGTVIHNGDPARVYPGYQVNSLFEDIIPDAGNQERYSSRIAGVLNITTSGNYTFACSSDDVGFLYLSSDESAAKKVQIATEPAWNGPRQYTAGGNQGSRGSPAVNFSAPQSLTAGSKYYLEFIYTEGGGGNNGSAAWQPPGGPAIVGGSLPIPASAFTPSRLLNGTTFTILGPVVVAQNPAPVTVPALSSASFSVKVDGTPGYSFQWKRNGVNIPGATGSTYSIAVAQPGDDGAQFSVAVANEFSSATSGSALLTVLNPTPPRLVSAQVDTTFSKVTVRFDNRLQPSSANDPLNYSIPGTTVMTATRDASGRNVVLVIAPALAEGTTYTLTVGGVFDETGTALQDPNPASVNFTTLVFTPGYVLKEFFNQFSGGNVDPFILAHRAGTIAPFRTCLTNLYEINHQDILDNYGGRMSGYYVADETGPHVFFIATDDPGRLFLSTDENPANAVLVAREPVWSGRRTWIGEAGGGGRVGNVSPSGGPQANTSGAMNLVAGQRYFIESFFTEGGGGDNMAVAVRKPSAAADPVNGSTPITAANLGMYFDPSAASLAITQNPMSQTIDENGFATFTVAATGSSPLCGGSFGVRWLKNGVPIPGAIGQSYTFGPASTNDSGAVFTAQASVPGRNLLSDPATLNVNVDTNPPVVTLALGSATFDSITLIFNELYDATSAADSFSYTVTGPGGPLDLLNVTGLTLAPDGRTVILTTDPQTEDTIYTIDYSAVADLKGNLAGANAAMGITTAHSFVAGCSGVVFDIFNQVGGGTDINILVNHPTFPNSPDETRLLTTFDTGADFRENYGGRVRGLFIPPVSGAWMLYVTADDGSRLFFNPTGPSAAGKVLVSEETPGCCTAFAGRPAGPFNLVGGRGYYLEGIYKEAGGGDYIRVAARLASDTTTPLAPMPSAWAGVPAAPPGVGGPVDITVQPVSLVITQNQRATFSVVASNPNGLPLCYQWKKNNVDIMGANGPTYSYTPVPLSDSNSTFQVMVSVIGTRASSAIVTLGVEPDLIRPACVEARGSVSLVNVVVRYSEFMDPVTATDLFSYAVDGVANITAAVLNPDGMSVTLTLPAPLAIGSGTHTVTVQNVTDLSGNVIDPSPCTLTFSAPIISCGFLYFESFKNIGGATLPDLTGNAAYPNSPSEVGYVGGFNSRSFYPTDSLENYGARMRGLFIPPTSGNWIFYIRSDDASRLLLNPTGPDAAGAVMMTEEPGCCRNFSALASAPQALTAGQMYYIEGLYKEGGGGDYMQVAAKLDTDPTNPDQLQPISGEYLATLADPVGASVSVSNPADQLNILDPQNLSLSNSTFSVVATGGSAASPGTGIYYQWKRNGANIPGANGSSYSLNPKLSDNGAKFSVSVYVPGATAVSSEATLTVVQPNTSPQVVCSPGGIPAILEDAGAQNVPGVLSILSPHSITRAQINYGGNFNSGLPPGAVVSGNAAVSGGVLHLTDALNGQTGGFVTPSVAAPIDTLTVDFKARIGGGTCCGTRTADGWSLTIGNVTVPLGFPVAAEEGAAQSGGFVVSFDSWDNGGLDDPATAPNVDVKVGGSIIAYQAFAGDREGGRAPSGPFINDPATMAPMSYSTGNDFVPVRVSLTSDGKLNVDFKGVRVVNDVATGLTLPLTNTRLAFGARTGGANDNHWIDDLSVVAFTVDNSAAELGQTVQVNVTTDRPDLFSVQPTIDASGTLSYTPAPNACGTARVTAVAQDNGGTAYGGSDSAPACQFDIVIGCLPDCPVANNQSLTTPNKGAVLNIVLTGSDVDGDALTYTVVSGPLHGTLSGSAPNLSYVASPAGYAGPDSITFEVSDGQCTNVGTISITVLQANHCPVAGTQSLNTPNGGAVLNIVLAGSDVDGDALTFAVSTIPANGTLSGTAPNLTYVASPTSYVGPDSFTYTVSDGICTVSGTINITVVSANQCPIARIVVDPLCVKTGAHTMLILANQDDEGCVILDGRTSSDADGNPLTYSWFADGGLLPISIRGLTTNCFSIGEHTVTLMVDDGTCIGATNVTFEVVTACDLVENLIADINNSTLPRNKKRPLIASLKKICKIFEKDKKNEFKYAVKKLESFQKKLKGELKNYPAHQAQYHASAQSIIDAINCAVDLQKKKKQHGH